MNMIIERTSTGKAVARATIPGWREGRKKKTIDMKRYAECRKKNASGEMTVGECCAELGISKSLWYKKIKTA